MAQAPVKIDFQDYLQRMQRGQGGRALLLKAVGLTQTNRSILDATGGLLRDAFFMARFGGEVTVIERSPLLAKMIEAALPDLPAEIKLNFLEGNAIDLIPQLSSFEVIYLDPMFQEIKSAKAKKDLQFLQALHANAPDDAPLLLETALHYATERVVVKRAIKAPFLADRKPDWSLFGKTIRFDVFKAGITL